MRGVMHLKESALKKILEGALFGIGFGISFIVIWYLAAYFVTPILFDAQISRTTIESSSEQFSTGPESAQTLENSFEVLNKFHELDVDEQIKLASVIAVAKYVPSDDGKSIAVISEILKMKPDTTFYYEIGDEFPESSFFPEDHTIYGDGLVIFFTGSPAIMRLSMTYSGERIRSLGDLPLKLFREKCKEADA